MFHARRLADSDIPRAKHVLSLVEGTQRRQVRKRKINSPLIPPSRLGVFAVDIPMAFFAFFAPPSTLLRICFAVNFQIPNLLQTILTA